METITCTPDKTIKQIFKEIIRFTKNTPTELELYIHYYTNKDYKVEAIIIPKDIPIRLRIETENPLEEKTEEDYIKELKISVSPQEKHLYIKKKRKYILLAKDFFYIDYLDNAIYLGEFYAHTLTWDEYRAKVRQ